MLSAFSRLFQTSSASEPEPDSFTEKGQGRTSTSTAQDSGIHLERKPSSHLSIPMERIRAPTPSHVSWKVPSPNPSQPTSVAEPPWSMQYDSHSVSAPSLLLLNPGSQRQRAESLRRHSSQSLHAHSLLASASEDSERRVNLEVQPTRQILPLDERVHFPAVRRPSIDSVPLTPDSTRVHDGHKISLSAYPGAFINRPLNRSASQASTSTFRSTASVAPPIIPPLDLRPDFQSTVGIPPRRSRLAAPSLPTVVSSPKYSVIYEDGSSARTSSFITAPSEHTPEHDSDDERAVDISVSVRTPDLNVSVRMHDYAYAASSRTGTEGTPAPRTSGLPEGLYDVDLAADHEPRHRAQASSAQASSLQPLLGGPSAIPRRPHSFSSGDSESYILKRWLKGVSYSSDRFAIPIVKRKRIPVSLACVLFWVGFVGPWCWLIGGWMLSNGGDVTLESRRSETVLPLWRRRGKQREGLSDRDRHKLLALRLWYPLVAPSVESLCPSVHSNTSVASTRKMKQRAARTIDIWVTRCRIAAITSGVVIVAVFVVALIVVGSRSS
ncbi:hypothetical protein POSPLADRAFT_1157117 [Postia placenta MAD-698-R-SB12]|uniref:Uncharacterized protein n=1 Tax=Postia placenta MAD-698-R-SB12 TaxID=670580 RepID=A0A1X6MM01_9APHY|nr:hypothetical protein POSPLADRAFT_1157117 [Postia placenta MAD-698-R-SB12]OSX57400.1 hypothetical protein POSPLADRAFT_1157117 [Postia placenta MAD-698-R-SB12]